ncbi:MAG: MBL fold metallo-hydrolase [Bacteriovoracia bacterium]
MLAPAPYVFFQLFEPETSTYTYLLADGQTGEAVIIDSVLEMIERDYKWITEAGLKLLYAIDTHLHADHVTGAGELKKRTGARTAIAAAAKVGCADIALKDGDELRFGRFSLKALATPGHTDSCMSYYCEGRVFTGDALLIRGCGRTDFQQGSSDKLYQSVHEKLFSLPPETIVHPGHDYKGLTSTTVALERAHNPRLGGGKTREQFAQIMRDLKLAPPKKIDVAVPANLKCGVV